MQTALAEEGPIFRPTYSEITWQGSARGGATAQSLRRSERRKALTYKGLVRSVKASSTIALLFIVVRQALRTYGVCLASEETPKGLRDGEANRWAGGSARRLAQTGDAEGNSKQEVCLRESTGTPRHRRNDRRRMAPSASEPSVIAGAAVPCDQQQAQEQQNQRPLVSSATASVAEYLPPSSGAGGGAQQRELEKRELPDASQLVRRESKQSTSPVQRAAAFHERLLAPMGSPIQTAPASQTPLRQGKSKGDLAKENKSNDPKMKEGKHAVVEQQKEDATGISNPSPSHPAIELLKAGLVSGALSIVETSDRGAIPRNKKVPLAKRASAASLAHGLTKPSPPTSSVHRKAKGSWGKLSSFFLVRSPSSTTTNSSTSDSSSQLSLRGAGVSCEKTSSGVGSVNKADAATGESRPNSHPQCPQQGSVLGGHSSEGASAINQSEGVSVEPPSSRQGKGDRYAKASILSTSSETPSLASVEGAEQRSAQWISGVAPSQEPQPTLSSGDPSRKTRRSRSKTRNERDTATSAASVHRESRPENATGSLECAPSQKGHRLSGPATREASFQGQDAAQALHTTAADASSQQVSTRTRQPPDTHDPRRDGSTEQVVRRRHAEPGKDQKGQYTTSPSPGPVARSHQYVMSSAKQVETNERTSASSGILMPALEKPMSSSQPTEPRRTIFLPSRSARHSGEGMSTRAIPIARVLPQQAILSQRMYPSEEGIPQRAAPVARVLPRQAIPLPTRRAHSPQEGLSPRTTPVAHVLPLPAVRLPTRSAHPSEEGMSPREIPVARVPPRRHLDSRIRQSVRPGGEHLGTSEQAAGSSPSSTFTPQEGTSYGAHTESERTILLRRGRQRPSDEGLLSGATPFAQVAPRRSGDPRASQGVGADRRRPDTNELMTEWSNWVTSALEETLPLEVLLSSIQHAPREASFSPTPNMAASQEEMAPQGLPVPQVILHPNLDLRMRQGVESGGGYSGTSAPTTGVSVPLASAPQEAMASDDEHAEGGHSPPSRSRGHAPQD